MYRMPNESEGASCSESHLSEMMPDVAMATASLGHLQLNEPAESLQLDLGDGSSHIMANASIPPHGMQVISNIQFHSMLLSLSIIWPYIKYIYYFFLQ